MRWMSLVSTVSSPLSTLYSQNPSLFFCVALPNDCIEQCLWLFEIEGLCFWYIKLSILFDNMIIIVKMSGVGRGAVE